MYGQVWPNGPVRFVARNADTGQVIADRVGIAATRVARAVGLLPRTGLERGEALWIVPSRGVHTWGMRFSIDLIALDAEGRVVDTVSALKPWRVRLPKSGVVGVLELPTGALEQSDTKVGHTVMFEVMRDA
jgi:uncharacterized membrane protein (UPF0127 family)